MRLLRRTLLPLLASPAIARAQGSDWPKGPIKVVVPFPPGGTTDPVARLLAAKVSDNTGWATVIDNKPGAAGAIGAAIAAKAPPDGQTWMVTFDSHILSPAFTPNLPYKDADLFNVMGTSKNSSVRGVSVIDTDNWLSRLTFSAI